MPIGKLPSEVAQCVCGKVIRLDGEILPGCTQTRCAACQPVRRCQQTQSRRIDFYDDDEDDFDYGVPFEDDVELFEYLLHSTN